jgi:lipoprotein-anchoring transpeptidase ErfK/SrfK
MEPAMSLVRGKLRRALVAASFALSALLLAAVAAEARTEAGAAPGKVLIQVDKRSQRMIVYVDGEKRYSFRVSTGRRGHETPGGAYGVKRLEAMHYSRKYDDAPMPHAIFFRGGYAIHGTAAVGRLGHPASHGCVRLSNRDAATLYALVQRAGQRNVRIRIG